MLKPVRSLIVAMALFASAVAVSDELQLDAPKVMLRGLPVDVLLENAEGAEILVRFNGQAIARGSEVFRVALKPADTGVGVLEVLRNGEVSVRREIPVIPGWVSVLPPLIAILLAFVLRSVVPSLFAGLLVGAWAINGMTWSGAFTGIFDTLTIYILDAMINPDHGAIILFTMMIGGMVGIISRNGGMLGIVNRVIPIAKTPRRGQAVVASLGLSIFFDDYTNTMIVGNATRAMSDHLRISREKLAYLVDSTAAPVATVAIITTWIGFQVGLIDEAIKDLDGLQQPAYALFLQSVPYSFYAFLAVFFVFLVVLTGRDFGPMYRAEIRARTSGEVSRARATKSGSNEMAEFERKAGVPCRAVNGVLPILFLVAGVIGGIFISGEGDTLQEIMGSANAYTVLIWASLLACLAAIILSVGQRILSLEEVVDAWTTGAKFMLTGLILLVLAWAIADVASVLQTAPYLISILGDSLSPQTLPTMVFLLAAAAGFASGSSWGVMAILMPLVIPLCWAVLETNGMLDAQHMHILYSCIACVLTGAVWADHCSPISDTTVLSSLATGCDHMDHVTTQLPYALLGGTVAILVCTLPAGYGVPWWLLLPMAAVVLALVHHFLGKATDPE